MSGDLRGPAGEPAGRMTLTQTRSFKENLNQKEEGRAVASKIGKDPDGGRRLEPKRAGETGEGETGRIPGYLFTRA